MALIIRGKMPETCDKCWNRYSCDAYFRQVERMKQSKNEQVFDVFGEMRLKCCPIIGEIPDKYGRLIDADAFKNSVADMRMEKPLRNGAKQVIEIGELFGRIIDDAPTIVEATE